MIVKSKRRSTIQLVKKDQIGSRIKVRANARKKKRPEDIATRIKKSLFKPRHTLVRNGRVYNVCKTCPSSRRKFLDLRKRK
jgi:recombinational DNA repair ATPase RecF